MCLLERNLFGVIVGLSLVISARIVARVMCHMLFLTRKQTMNTTVAVNASMILSSPVRMLFGSFLGNLLNDGYTSRNCCGPRSAYVP